MRFVVRVTSGEAKLDVQEPKETHLSDRARHVNYVSRPRPLQPRCLMPASFLEPSSSLLVSGHRSDLDGYYTIFERFDDALCVRKDNQYA